MQNPEFVIFNPLSEVNSDILITDYKAVEFDPANFDNQIEGFAIGSFNSTLLKFKNFNTLWGEETLDQYANFVKENLRLGLIKPRDCKDLIIKLNGLEQEVNNLIATGDTNKAIRHLEHRLMILTAYC
jgi:CDP-glycerol glycerophosphotransferase (TagB/SpsB family)